MLLRPYHPDDAEPTLAVFLAAVQVTAAADYSPEQVAAWARPGSRDAVSWGVSRAAQHTVVAELDGAVAGFGGLAASHVDMLFVHPDAGRRGIARALLAAMETEARASGIESLTADVSVTARPAFESAGFAVVEERQPVRDGIRLRNFRMAKRLA